MEAAAGGMSGGKRNHEDLSDMMALVEAACKVPAISARLFAYRQAASAVTCIHSEPDSTYQYMYSEVLRPYSPCRVETLRLIDFLRRPNRTITQSSDTMQVNARVTEFWIRL